VSLPEQLLVASYRVLLHYLAVDPAAVHLLRQTTTSRGVWPSPPLRDNTVCVIGRGIRLGAGECCWRKRERDVMEGD
jgi:hypothetical protein